jgi:hypothetical protein
VYPRLRRTSLVVLLSLGGLLALADEPAGTPSAPRLKSRPARNSRAAAPVVDEARERAVLAFVRENHPELAALLEQLKAMKPAEYARAIAELSQVSRSLAKLKADNPRRYQVGLELWKAKSNAELLAARWMNGPSAELESQLRAALENQIDVEIRQQELVRDQLRARLEAVEGSIARMNKNREKRIESRLQSLRNKNERSRKPEPGKSAPTRTKTRTKPGRTKGENHS